MSVSDSISGEFEAGQEDLSKYKGDKGQCLRWLRELDLVMQSRAQKNFEKFGEAIVKDYRAATSETRIERSRTARPMYNIVWATVQILKPVLFARLPKIVAERRHKDSDPVGRLAASILEHSTSYMLDIQSDRAFYVVKSVVEDKLLPGRGTAWLRFDAEFQAAEQNESISDEDVEKEEEAPTAVAPHSERVYVDYVHWLDFFHSPARNPYELRWVAKRAYMTRAELVERFGDVGKKVELGSSSTGKVKKNLTQEEKEFLTQAEVFEIWCSEDKKVYWVSPGYKEACLDIKDDPLKLTDFWPCPLPLLATTTTDSMYPTPDFKIYEQLLEELDKTTKRVSAMVECIRFVGAVATSFSQDVKSILSLEDGQLFPIDNWARWAESGSFKGNIDWIPFDNAIAAIEPLLSYQQHIIDQIFQLSRIPDIVRGVTDPTETLGAQQQKQKWTSVNVQESQQDVQRFCRELVTKIGEIIVEPGLFSDETIMLMDGYEQRPDDEKQMYPQALALLRQDELRTFRIDIETDSTIAIDEDQEKASRMEYMQAVGNLIQQMETLSQFRPELIKPVVETTKFALRPFRAGRSLEYCWEAALDQIETNQEQAAMNPPPPPPDYEGQKIEVQRMKAEADAQAKMQEINLKGMELQQSFELESQKIQIEGSKVYSETQMRDLNSQLETFKFNFQQYIEEQKLELERTKTVLIQQEKMLTEQRLQREDAERAAKAMSGENGNFDKSPPINVHIHPANKAVKLMRNQMDGSIEGHTKDIIDG